MLANVRLRWEARYGPLTEAQELLIRVIARQLAMRLSCELLNLDQVPLPNGFYEGFGEHRETEADVVAFARRLGIMEPEEIWNREAHVWGIAS